MSSRTTPGIHLAYLSLGLLSFCLSISVVAAQSGFYDQLQVQEIRLEIPLKSWRSKLDSLMKSGDDSTRIIGDVVLNGTRVKSAGIRFKGFSSWNEGAVKNPFNVELDYLIENRNYKGHKKIRLSNVIHDPSFLREVLAYQIARSYMPASEAGYARLYVNDTLVGLYTNVESVDDLFMEKHFGDAEGFLVKGSPVKLIYPFGQNANLAWISNTDSSVYQPYYELISEFGWESLLKLIDILNNDPDSLDHYLNTDRALWMHAFNYAIVNLDSYIGYAQNYYLAMDPHGRFNTIPWDLNMSFGSFRSSDGSTHFQGLTLDQTKKVDPLQHLSFSISPRPLITKLLQDSTLRKMYMAHLRTLVNDWFVSGLYLQELLKLHNLVEPYVLEDTNKFYSYSDFLLNMDTTVGGSGNMISYPGIRELMEARMQYLITVPGYTGEPAITSVSVDPVRPEQGETVWITAVIEDGSDAWLYYRLSGSDLFERVAMADDGMHHDSVAGDGRYGAGIVTNGDVVHYYFYAQNDSAGVFSPEKAESRYYTLFPLIKPGSFVINEIRKGSHPDANLYAEIPGDWIEFHNNSRDTLSLSGLWLSNDTNQYCRWPFPDSLVPPGGFWIVVADPALSDAHHCGFSLADDEGWIGLAYAPERMQDEVSYRKLDGGLTLGRYPNGVGNFMLMPATCARRNVPGPIPASELLVFPNPAKGQTTVSWIGVGGHCQCGVYSADGRCWFSAGFDDNGAGMEVSKTFQLAHLPAGAYRVQVTCKDSVMHKTLIIYE